MAINHKLLKQAAANLGLATAAPPAQPAPPQTLRQRLINWFQNKTKAVAQPVAQGFVDTNIKTPLLSRLFRSTPTPPTQSKSSI